MNRTIAIAFTLLFAGMALAGCATNNNSGNNGGTSTPTTGGTISAPGGGGAATAPCAVPGKDINAPLPNTDTKQPTGSAANKDVYTMITGAGEAESLDPGYDYESAGGQILQNVYETLYYYDNTSAVKLVPRLAADYPTCSADQTELTIPIRHGVKFHDGNTLTAEDVKFSLDRIILMNDPDGPANIFYTPIKGGAEYGAIDVTEAKQSDRDAYLAAGGVTVVDNFTVKFKLAYPDPSFLYRLAFYGASIVSKKGFCENNKGADIGPDCLPVLGKTRDSWADTHEIGTGPYMLDHWQKGTEMVLKRFDSYWGTPAKMKTVIIKNIDDFNTRLLALKNGDADEIYVPVDHDKDVNTLEGVEIMEDPSWAVSFIGYNEAFCGGSAAATADKAKFDKCMTDNADSAPKGADGKADPDFFADIHMRKAWSYAFDYDTYINSIVNKHGKLLNGVLPEGIFGYDPHLQAPRRNLDTAKAEFAQTKHKDGFTVTIFYNSGNTVREKTAALLAQNLQELGPNIHVDTKGLDFSTTFLGKQRAKALPVFYLGWLPDYAFPDNYLIPFAHSQDGVYAKRVGYHNAEVDALIGQLLRETNQQNLTAGYSKLAQQINNDFAYMFLAQATNYHVQRDWVQGFYYNPMQSGVPNTGDFSRLSKV